MSAPCQNMSLSAFETANTLISFVGEKYVFFMIYEIKPQIYNHQSLSRFKYISYASLLRLTLYYVQRRTWPLLCAE